jgi:O-antigen ligase
MNPLQQQACRVNSWLLMLLAFCLPLSTSAISAAALLVLTCWLIEGGFRQKWEEIAASPMCLAVLIYFGILLIGLCWTDDLFVGLAAIRKQWKLLLVPVLLTTVRWERRWQYVAAFIAGMTVVMLLICLARFDLLVHIGLESIMYVSLLNNGYIVIAPMLALAIYLLLHLVLWGGTAGWKRWLLILLAGFMIFTLFITKGRAGQLVFFMLLALLLFQYYRGALLKATFMTIILLPLVFTAGYRLSPVFQERMDLVWQDIAAPEKNPETGVGLRLIFWENSMEIIRSSPWLGVGTGGFNLAYAKVNQQRSPNVPSTDNPHNQYISAAVQQGVFGVLGLLGLFGVQLYQSRRTRDGWERIRLAFPLFFLTIMATDCYLNTPSSGFLFALFSAILSKTESCWQNCTPRPRIAATN